MILFVHTIKEKADKNWYRGVIKVEVIKVDSENLKYVKFPLFIPKASENMTDEEMLKYVKTVNVGDFVILPDQSIYRRIRGGWRKATDDDLAELITSQI